MDILNKKNGSKYLLFDSTDEKREVLEKYTYSGMGLKMKLRQ